jgi:hypothetical protein
MKRSWSDYAMQLAKHWDQGKAKDKQKISDNLQNKVNKWLKENTNVIKIEITSNNSVQFILWEWGREIWNKQPRETFNTEVRKELRLP